MALEKIGRYEVKAELGRGGMATVYLGRDPRFKRDVAIKVLPPQLLENATFRARFEREAEIIASIEHPAIVPVYDFGDEDGQLYLVMRFMAGGSLADQLKNGPISFSKATQILSRLAPALDAVHSHGIIHRDLKPANILFDQWGNSFLSDFGIARLAQATTATLTGEAIIGTPSYMSPEQVRGEADIDGRSDIYALGAILYEMLTGKQPYEATTPMGVALKQITEPVPRILDVNASLPFEIETVISTAMAKEREDRFGTAVKMVETQEAILSHLTQSQAVAPEPFDQSPPPHELPSSSLAFPSKLDTDAARQPQPEAVEVPQPPEEQEKERIQAHLPVSQTSVASPIPPLADRSPRPGPAKTRRAGFPVLGALLGLVLIGGVCGLAGLFYAGSSLFPSLKAGLVSLETAPPVIAETEPAAPPSTQTLAPTATHLPDPTDTPQGGYAPPILGTPTLGLQYYRDDFSDPDSGWFRGQNGGTTTEYENGHYRVFVDEINTVFWSTPDRNFSDVTLEVDATKVAGANENYYGLVCRIKDADNFYLLVLSGDGYYNVGKYQDGKYISLMQKGWVSSKEIRQGDSPNHIRADCVGNVLALYVNETKLVEVTDSEYTSGDVGVAVGTFGTAGERLLFDNFVAKAP